MGEHVGHAPPAGRGGLRRRAAAPRGLCRRRSRHHGGRRRHRRPAAAPPRLEAPLPEPLRRYFRPGFNWAGRAVYGIPVFGFALLAMSQGAYALGDGWVLAGLALFVAVASSWPRGCCGRPSGGSRPPSRPPGRPPAPSPEPRSADRDATSMVRAAGVALVLLVAGDGRHGGPALTTERATPVGSPSVSWAVCSSIPKRPARCVASSSVAQQIVAMILPVSVVSRSGAVARCDRDDDQMLDVARFGGPGLVDGAGDDDDHVDRDGRRRVRAVARGRRSSCTPQA